ncbi:two-component response regulator-like APRR2 isoform X1 [Momordica charantia]|uniref:Two-component response regulator-like APRR2 isoform X1 n=1 Tax=Momordica charantia TaxID=3673 RepID=A0A6J1DQT4_MOMCH|nr:two-component response regulator-like APRR2 isoform X1 [Momordica charantia]XP_022156610.1 two-component response regulator-like APRR2 isoform X1 [Momordica charantia]
MVCTADDLQGWKDFPKGLRVLLLDRDSRSTTEIRSRLEEMEYVVYSCCDEKEALSAILNTPGNFHVAILEVCTGNYDESFKLLEISKDLPIIMTSDVHCLSTMMKCIALGAVEFLLKPLSEEKLRNIWQHVIHKAFSNPSKPDEESVASLMQLQLENEDKNGVPEDMEILSWVQDIVWEQSEESEKSQLNQGASLICSWESQDQMNDSRETGCRDKETQSKLVKTTSHDLVCEEHLSESDSQPQLSGKNKSGVKSSPSVAEHSIQGSDVNHSAGLKVKKTKVDWTPDLHRKFVQAVEQLGIDHAIPSKILELMKVEGLTRHNVASHLQKYRMQKRHVIHREEIPRWPHPRCSMQFNHLKPIMAYPSSHPNCGLSVSAVYPTWRQTNGHPANVHMWGPPGYRHWPQPGIQPWNSYTGVQADAWGCPVMLPSHAPYFSNPHHVSAPHNLYTVNKSHGMPQRSFDLQPDEEMIDKVVKEAMRKPWSPLPLGLKPPSTESVLSELSRQGISTVPPHINGSRPP